MMMMICYSREGCDPCGPWIDNLRVVERKYRIPLRVIYVSPASSIRTPTTVLVDDDGEIMGTWIGAGPRYLGEMETMVREM